MKNIILLGSTGSVGQNVLNVVRHFPDKFRIKALSSYSNVSLLAAQAEEFNPDLIAIGEEKLYSELKSKVSEKVKILAGSHAAEDLSGGPDEGLVFMAISGSAALKPLFAALSSGKNIALASKEPVVSAGMLIHKIIKDDPARIIPVDSEHSAIRQCLSGREKSEVETLYITGSGGSLKDKNRSEFDALSHEEILNHPKWNMGKKITVDSATLMNKGLEVIEARWLFDQPPERIKIIIHPEAIIHSMVEFRDGTISASLFCPDMKFPIIRALSEGGITENDFPKVDFNTMNKLSFLPCDVLKFPSIDIAYAALRTGGTMPAVLSASNETAVKLFLDKKIKFTDIMKIVEKVLNAHKTKNDPSLRDILNSEKWAEEEVLRFC